MLPAREEGEEPAAEAEGNRKEPTADKPEDTKE